METVSITTPTASINPVTLQNWNYLDTSAFKKTHTNAPFQSHLDFEGSISVGDFAFASQTFSWDDQGNLTVLQNYPSGSTPNVRIVVEKKGQTVKVKDFIIRPSDKSVLAEILYTRLFLMISEEHECSLNIEGIDFPLRFGFDPQSNEEKKKMFYRAKLCRKLGFLENIFNTKLFVPDEISPDAAHAIEILFRGVTEGEFTAPLGGSLTITDPQIIQSALADESFAEKRAFSFKFKENYSLFDKEFLTGEVTLQLRRAALANLRQFSYAQKLSKSLPFIRFRLFDDLACYKFDKYFKEDRLRNNKRKLEEYKKGLRTQEPEFLVSLCSELLVELSEKSASEIVDGLLEFYGFPDRFVAQQPILYNDKWRVPITIAYPNAEPIWLEDAFVDIRTGEVQISVSFDNLLEKGKRLAKEAMLVG